MTVIDFDAGTTLVRRGECNQCGACCDTSIAYELSAATPEHGIWRRLETGQWYRSTQIIVASGRCQYLTKMNTCLIYATKPELCCEFPLLPGEIMSGCGYVFELEPKDA